MTPIQGVQGAGKRGLAFLLRVEAEEERARKAVNEDQDVIRKPPKT